MKLPIQAKPVIRDIFSRVASQDDANGVRASAFNCSPGAKCFESPCLDLFCDDTNGCTIPHTKC
jgi:hypothetical protein